jgi:carbon starvation protein
MSLLALAVLTILVLSLGYVAYGTFIARQYAPDPDATTPAASKNDGIDFVPTRPFYLMGQHFSAIAAAGPIVGPILACQQFGWLPCLLWILIGVVFIGAVHDFSALIASVRHGAHGIAEIARQNLGHRAFVALTLFIWVALLYVIVAFTDATAATFVGTDPDLAALAGSDFNRGGAVAAASVLYLAVALAMGLVERFLKPPMWLSTLLFVPATLAAVWLGTKVSTWFVLPVTSWYWIILGYCLLASMLPVWLLQQSRGYLGGFVLYLAIGLGVVGLLFGGYDIKQPMVADAAGGFSSLWAVFVGSVGAPPITTIVFPFLFVTIACGACSGFHGLVCGGTTSKQIARETHCKPVAFGAMLLEGFVAVIALSTVMIAAPADLKGPDGKPMPPGAIYGEGLARFMTLILGPDALVFAKTFGTMAVATFVFDTLDVATRLGRYLLQELFKIRHAGFGFAAALLTVGVPLGILLAAEPKSYLLFWTLFGTSNQLLAGLTLLGVTVWLKRRGKPCWYTLVPTLFIMTITLTALLAQIVIGVRVASTGTWMKAEVLNAGVGLILLGLAVMFIVQAVRVVRERAPH